MLAMKKRYLIFCVLILAISVLAQNKTGEMEVLEFVEKYQNAHVARDTAFIESVLTEDYSYTNPQGASETRAAYLDYITKEKAKPSYAINAFKNDRLLVRVFGDTAVVTSDWTFSTTSVNAHQGDQPHQDKGRYTGILVKQNGRWMMLHEHDSEQPHDKAVMEKQVAALGRAYTAMIQRNDAAAIAKILADDYLVTDESGNVLTKEQDLATYKDRAKSIKIEEVEYKDQKVRMITGSVATEHSTIRFIGTKNGKPFDITERITTTWQFRDGRWVIAADHFSYVKP
jgi:uncharacterized protein (TIGR02246 family)